MRTYRESSDRVNNAKKRLLHSEKLTSPLMKLSQGMEGLASMGGRRWYLTHNLPVDGCQALLSIHTDALLISITFVYDRKQDWWYIVMAED